MRNITKNSKAKKAISLKAVIEKNLKDPEFADLYQKEQLINALAKMIRDIRKKTGMTQSEFAKEVQTTQPVIARLESGKDSRTPSLDLLMRIANAAGTRLNIKFQA
jgi:ribosome-binding protein aMBF1 (putative translation factor)